MMTLQQTSTKLENQWAQPSFREPRVDSVTIENYIRGLCYPADKAGIIRQADLNGAPDNIMAFFINRLPSRQFRSAADISFTLFVSSYMFGQD
jgi:hypothetical protein